MQQVFYYSRYFLRKLIKNFYPTCECKARFTTLSGEFYECATTFRLSGFGFGRECPNYRAISAALALATSFNFQSCGMERHIPIRDKFSIGFMRYLWRVDKNTNQKTKVLKGGSSMFKSFQRAQTTEPTKYGRGSDRFDIPQSVFRWIDSLCPEKSSNWLFSAVN
jgi:hypothetical protein